MLEFLSFSKKNLPHEAVKHISDLCTGISYGFWLKHFQILLKMFLDVVHPCFGNQVIPTKSFLFFTDFQKHDFVKLGEISGQKIHFMTSSQGTKLQGILQRLEAPNHPDIIMRISKGKTQMWDMCAVEIAVVFRWSLLNLRRKKRLYWCLDQTLQFITANIVAQWSSTLAFLSNHLIVMNVKSAHILFRVFVILNHFYQMIVLYLMYKQDLTDSENRRYF